ncbi:MAG TPA: PUA domain-containing protein, partial [Streptosporangiaceae bacterium]|nr:PUA domain-containing protein [Streptosporangiaceae bacterium]
ASHGSIVINRPAEDSIRAGASLFASGIKKVDGQFRGGDVIDVLTPSGRLVARGESKVSATLMNLIRAMRTDEIAIVLTAILDRFRQAGTPGEAAMPGGSGAAVAGQDAGLRVPVSRALDIVSRHGYELTRRLALEIINLFPGATAELMLDARADPGLAPLRQRYSRLSSDLSFIDRQRLVVY